MRLHRFYIFRNLVETQLIEIGCLWCLGVYPMLWTKAGEMVYSMSDGSCYDYGLGAQGIQLSFFLMFMALKDLLLDLIFTGYLLIKIYKELEMANYTVVPVVITLLLKNIY